jgi:hypothetical protein
MRRKPCLKTYHPTIAPPAYPFRGPELFCDLRRRLSHGRSGLIPYQELGQMIGKSKSTTHHWFAIFHQPQVLTFMCLLERLDAKERGEYIEKHCRIFPSLKHHRLNGNPSLARKLRKVLGRKTGLTCIVGGTAIDRSFVIAALGHEACAGNGSPPAGFSMCRPDEFVPVESVIYIEPFVAPSVLRNIIEESWPRMVTSTAGMLILDRVWAGVKRRQEQLLHISLTKHCIIAEEVTPDELRRYRVGIELLDLGLPGLEVMRSSKR